MLQKYKTNSLKLNFKFITKFNFNKLLILNFLNNFKKLIIINTALTKSDIKLNIINIKVIKGLGLNIPISGNSKLIPFKSILNLNYTLTNLNKFINLINVKFYNKIYNIHKFNIVIKKKNFITLINLSKFLNFFKKIYLNLLKLFYLVLKK